MYGSVEDSSTDQKALDECLRVLKPGGKLLLTTPVAKQSHQDSFMRWYTTAGLKKMLSAWDNMTSSYYVPSNDRQYWKESSAKGLPEPPAFGVALVIAEKPKTQRKS
jgi:ubiquinone/menaquinone biosynthesis C-methylase UbiE